MSQNKFDYNFNIVLVSTHSNAETSVEFSQHKFCLFILQNRNITILVLFFNSLPSASFFIFLNDF